MTRKALMLFVLIAASCSSEAGLRTKLSTLWMRIDSRTQAG